MTLCDLSSFYCEKGGGVSTYHRARLDWFARQSRHRYVLISPGPRCEVHQVAELVWTVRVHGLRASRDPERYRILTDYAGVRAAVERFSPDILETHDPWFSLPIGLMLRHRGPFRGLLTTYCHSDPVRTYVHPRVSRCRWLSKTVDRFERWADRELHRLHGACHAVFVASDVMHQQLRGVGLDNIHRASFGVDPDLLRIARRRDHGPKQLLYAGRLDADKDFQIVLDVIPDLLRRRDVRITVAGAGKYQRQVGSIAHPRFRYVGHHADRRVMRAMYASHDILLAPGRYETFGLSALEGAAAGLLVVGPSEGGTGELLRQWRSPLTFQAGDVEGFRERVLAAVDGDHGPLFERGRALARQYGSWADAVARHVTIYESMLGAEAAEPASRIA